VLHEEINRLPEKYRAPVILCYLEGKTNEEVADLLQWPVGTVKGRLSRARDLLRSRLSRRGLALTAAFLVTALADGTVIADVVPPHLLDETVSNAMSIARRPGPDAGVTAEEAAIPAAVSQLMAYAGPSVQGGVKLAVVGALVLAILGALVSVGLSSGIFESVAYARSFLMSPTTHGSLAPGMSPAPAATGGACHSSSAPAPSSNP
jgi:hypothetical protein